jgi:hypothetical protein
MVGCVNVSHGDMFGSSTRDGMLVATALRDKAHGVVTSKPLVIAIR